MAKTTIVWLIVYVGGLLLSVINPLFGVLTYLWEYYLRPSLHWWGKDFPDLRWNLMVAVVLIVTFIMKRGELPVVEPVPNRNARWLIALACVMVLVSAAVAVVPDNSWQFTEQFWKYLVFYGLIIGVLRSEKAFDAFGAMHVFGAFYWGYEAYVNPQRSAGRLLNVGSADTLSDNLAAAHLLTVLPFVFVYMFTPVDRRLRLLAVASVPLIVNVFILCNSRGATVGLAAALATSILIARSRDRPRMVGVGVLCVALFFVMADPEFIERQQTTTQADDGSAQSRFLAWSGGLELIKDRPFGAGGGGFHYLSPQYIPNVFDFRESGRMAPHNTWILVASEWGVVGFVLFLLFIGSTLMTLSRVRRRCASDDSFFYYRSVALTVGFVGTLTAATFSDRFYGESIYWLAALAVVLERVQYTRLVEQQLVPSLHRVTTGPQTGRPSMRSLRA